MLSIQLVSLAALCIHYSTLTVLMHLSRTTQQSTSYRASSAVVMTELCKLVISLVVALYDSFHHTMPATPRPSPRSRFEPQFEDVTEEDAEDGEVDGHYRGTEALPDGERRTASKEEEEEEEEEEEPRWKEECGELISATQSRHERAISSEVYMPSSQTGKRRRLISGNGTTSPDKPALQLASQPRPDDHSYRMSVQASPLLARLNRHPLSKPLFSSRLPLALRHLHASIFGQDWRLLSIPALLFVLQNNLQYLAASNLSVPLFQITYQLKILTTALCSVLLLKRRLKKTQWISLLILTAGVAIVQLSSQPTTATSRSSSTAKKTKELLGGGSGSMTEEDRSGKMNQLVGLVAVIAACLSSGFASVYLERLFKSTGIKTSSPELVKKRASILYPPSPAGVQKTLMMPSTSIWIRNIQLSCFGLIVSMTIVFLENHMQQALQFFAACVRFLVTFHSDPVHLSRPNPLESLSTTYQIIHSLSAATTTRRAQFFTGFSGLTWLVILFQVSGGILNSIVMKYSNNINKNFSICLSIILSILFSRLLLSNRTAHLNLSHDQDPPSAHFNTNFFLGTSLVLFSTWLFNI
ncbi:hypothetical protein VP01_2676g2 [Puccinia sorghi]|uniref:UDP-galactose transporter n=1 Tax=Puccinia sorghi TaxID=27349 RepID=A0A0L6V5P1_9BASI|nr:hypothetical protein VP01_2676g2 [Puccinia sorghi]